MVLLYQQSLELPNLGRQISAATMSMMEVQLSEQRDIDLEVAKYVLTSVHYEGLAQAIRFIENKDPATGKYTHAFQPLAQLGICKICFLE